MEPNERHNKLQQEENEIPDIKGLVRRLNPKYGPFRPETRKASIQMEHSTTAQSVTSAHDHTTPKHYALETGAPACEQWPIGRQHQQSQETSEYRLRLPGNCCDCTFDLTAVYTSSISLL
ncbi:unnamed protein product [Schistocephalus solidus]|uniref:Uncharacterized protein n=1 Tax=Schistocephalus solidus TaxID=70667 RepID=A0A183T642_SCHSO|nr:unnamed protein product [Schistocephalus solidus]